MEEEEEEVEEEEPVPDVSVSLSPDSLEVSEDAGTVRFTVQLSQASSQQVTVRYATASRTAKAGKDYKVNTGTLTFPAGTTEQTFGVRILDDAVEEEDEMFQVRLRDSNATIEAGTATVVITANDAPATETVSADATLAGLTLSAGVLSPAFAATTYRYTATVSNDVETITVSAIASQGATVDAILPTDADAATSGHQVRLAVGENEVAVVVLAEDKTTRKSYTITVTRQEETRQESTSTPQLVFRITGALKGPARGADERQPRGSQPQQATLGLDPVGILTPGKKWS